MNRKAIAATIGVGLAGTVFAGVAVFGLLYVTHRPDHRSAETVCRQYVIAQVPGAVLTNVFATETGASWTVAGQAGTDVFMCVLEQTRYGQWDLKQLHVGGQE